MGKLTWSLWLLLVVVNMVAVLNILLVFSDNINWENYGKAMLALWSFPLPFMLIEYMYRKDVE